MRFHTFVAFYVFVLSRMLCISSIFKFHYVNLYTSCLPHFFVLHTGIHTQGSDSTRNAPSYSSGYRISLFYFGTTFIYQARDMAAFLFPVTFTMHGVRYAGCVVGKTWFVCGGVGESSLVLSIPLSLNRHVSPASASKGFRYS